MTLLINQLKQNTTMKTYKEKKSEARSEAIEWQYAFSDRDISWEELCEETEHFAKLAKRYGLTREFKQEGVI